MEEERREHYERQAFKPGDYVSFIAAAKLQQILDNGFAKIIDEDGFEHEVPVRVLREAYNDFKVRFDRKEVKRLGGGDAALVISPRGYTTPDYGSARRAESSRLDDIKDRQREHERARDHERKLKKTRRDG